MAHTFDPGYCASAFRQLSSVIIQTSSCIHSKTSERSGDRSFIEGDWMDRPAC